MSDCRQLLTLYLRKLGFVVDASMNRWLVVRSVGSISSKHWIVNKFPDEPTLWDVYVPSRFPESVRFDLTDPSSLEQLVTCLRSRG